jgi:glycosyltransferase involved in cell wall biosynthesis
MRIAFDGTTLRPGRTGVGYYTEHLLHHLVQEAPRHDVTVFSSRPVDVARALPAAVRIDTSRWRIPRMLWMQTVAPRMLERLAPDVAHFTNGMMPLSCPVPAVVTIHDMSLALYPRYHPPRRVLLNRPLVNLAVRRADAIITVSQSARSDIVRHYRMRADQVHVVTEAAAPEFHPVHDAARLESVRVRYGLASRFILYVGTIEPRKNLPKLLDAFARRRASGELSHQLVCVGPYGWLSRDIEEQLERLQIAPAVRFTGYVPFEDLPAIYNLAEMFVFPSIYEGFGLPVIEAMACGTPVITGPAAALAEVGGGAVEHVDELDAEGLGAALVKLAQSRERREHMAALGLLRASEFSWRRAARETLEVYRLVARSSLNRVAAAVSPLPDGAIDAHAGAARPTAAARETQERWGV